MPHRLIVLSLDGLATAALGPYGSSWCPTPTLNRLAADGGVFDRGIVSSDQPAQVLESMWSAPLTGGPQLGLPPNLPLLDAALARSLQTSLVTDSVEAAAVPSSERFANLVLIDPMPQPEACDEIGDTALARVLAAGIDRLEAAGDQPSLLWMHSDFLTRLWDAPRWLVPDTEAEDEGSDPEAQPPEDSGPAVAMPRAPKFFANPTPPQLVLSQGHDPDITLAWMNTYAAQIRLVDALLDVLLETIDPGLPTVLAVLGTSGFALGENGAIGHALGPLRSPRIQVPLLIRGPGVPANRAATPCRVEQLGTSLLSSDQPSPPAESLLRLLTPEAWSAPPDEWEPRIVTRSAATGTVAHTTPAWMYVRQSDGGEHLFLKPDDRTDINDVADRLSGVLDHFQAAAANDDQ